MNPKISVYSKVTAAATFFLIIAGALVTSTGSGLAVPDWPLSFGKYFPEMTGGVFFEHGHRMVAGAVGLLTFGLAVALWVADRRGWMKRLAAAAVGAVLLQATLGGLTVLYGLPPAVSIAHAVLAQTFFCIVTSIALFTSHAWHASRSNVVIPRSYAVRAAWTTALIFIQLILGAGVRHHAGLIFLHLHLAGAVLVIAFVTSTAWTGFSKYKFVGEIRKPSILLMSAIAVQIALGVSVYLPMLGLGASLMPARVSLVTAHVATGALILASSLALTLWSFRFSMIRTTTPDADWLVEHGYSLN